MDKQQWDLEFDKAMDDKFVTPPKTIPLNAR